MVRLLKACFVFLAIVFVSCSRNVPDTTSTLAGNKNAQEGRSLMGSCVLWPEEFDTQLVTGHISYSPNGRFLAFDLLNGQVGCFDMEAETVHVLRAPSIPSGIVGEAYWVGDSRLLMGQYTWSAAQIASLSAGTGSAGGPTHSSLEIDIEAITEGANEAWEASPGGWASGIKPVLWISDATWLCFDSDAQTLVTYDRASDAILSTIWEMRHADTNAWTPLTRLSPPWIAKLSGCLDGNGLPKPQGSLVELSTKNIMTHETRSVSGFPLPAPTVGVLITPDGRWAISAYHDASLGAIVPVVYDIDNELQRSLDDESWTPVALCASRGILLVTATDSNGLTQWYELLLARLTGQ